MINVELLTHQVEFVSDSEIPFIGLVGGYRSGKTVALCYKALMLANLNTQADGALLEPTYGMITRTLIPTFDRILNQCGLKFNLNKSDGFYEIQMGNRKKRIWLLSAENYAKAAGMTLSYFGIDEIDTMRFDVAQDAFNMMTSRLTKGECIQGFLTSTPEGFNFLHYFFEENKSPNRRLIRASTFDNPFIDEMYFDNLRATHTEQQLEAYLKGHFVNLTSGSVYYSFDRNLHHSDRELKESDKTLLIGQDFNVNNNSSVIYVYENEILYAVDEITGVLNTETTINIIKERYPNKRIMMYPDASGNFGSTRTTISDIALLKQAGFEVYTKNKNPFVKDRIQSVNVMLKDAKGRIRLYVNTHKCKQFTKALEQQGYVNGQPDKSSGLDHILDAGGYAVWYNFPVTGKSQVRQIY
jgi:hypothetical protein